MRLFKSKAFDRFAQSSRITDADLREAVERAERGFVYGFKKSALDNINSKELKNFKDSAKFVLKLSDKELATAIKHPTPTEEK